MADVLDNGPADSRVGPPWGRLPGGRRTRQWLGVGTALVVGAVGIAWAVRAPQPATGPSDLPNLAVVGGQVKLDTLDRAAALSLTVVNTGPSAFLDAMDGLPARLVFVPPRGGLPVPGGTGTQLPLAWPDVDCTTPVAVLTEALTGVQLVLRDALARGMVVPLTGVQGAVAEVVALRQQVCADLADT